MPSVPQVSDADSVALTLPPAGADVHEASSLTVLPALEAVVSCSSVKPPGGVTVTAVPLPTPTNMSCASPADGDANVTDADVPVAPPGVAVAAIGLDVFAP